jgi:hypothetical protein
MRVFSIVILFFSFFGYPIYSQIDSVFLSKIKFTSDFKLRAEYDWKSRKGDGSFRDDRSVLRYRIRFGLTYQYNNWASFGMRIRSGNLLDQQGVPITFGAGSGEFALAQIGVDKAYFKANFKNFSFVVGKDDTPFLKQNELFWSDHVLPEGASIKWKVLNKVDKISINAGHFINKSNGLAFSKDNYFQGIQLVSQSFNNRLLIFPSFYYFNAVPNLPDGFGTFLIKYKIAHLGLKYDLLPKRNFTFNFDFYKNLEDLEKNIEVPPTLNNQKVGYILGFGLGNLKRKGNWEFHVDYAHIEKYSIIDYFAQNDWTRLDYTSKGAVGARLSNFKGIDYKIGYAFDEKFNLQLRGFSTDQLLMEGTNFTETGNRIRLDLTIGF